MVKVKTPGRETFRNVPITQYFQRIPNPAKSSTTSDDVAPSETRVTRPKPTRSSNKKVLSPELNHNVIIIETDEDEIKSIPEIIEDDDDDLLLSATFDDILDPSNKRQGEETTLRRSSRVRKSATLEGYVPTVEAVPLEDVPMLHYVNGGTSRGTYTFSIDSLLKEKKSRDKTGYDLQAMERTLKEKESFGELEDPFAEYDREEISIKVLSEEKNKQLQKILNDDGQIQHDIQLDVFESPPKELPVSTLKGTGDKVYSFLSESSLDRTATKDILCNSLIPRQYQRGWQIPNEVIMWLLDIVSFVEDAVVADAAFNNLKQLAELHARYISFQEMVVIEIEVPLKRIFEILRILGVSPELLHCSCSLEERSRVLTSQEPISQLPLHFNISLLLKISAIFVECQCLRVLDNDEIRNFVDVMIRLFLDNRLWAEYYIIEQTIDVFINLFNEGHWVTQAKLICEDTALSCGNAMQMKVAVLENFPISNRGRLLRRLLAFRFLFTNSMASWNLTECDLQQPIKLGPLLDLFQDNCLTFKINSETNYHDLYNSVLILGFALDDNSQLRAERDVSEQIIKKLQHIHGKIVDMRAAFLDRTMAKDLIQRLFMRLYYVTGYGHGGKKQTSILDWH